MSESAPAAATLQFPRAATWFAAALLAGFGGVTAFSVLDRPKVAALETFEQPTAAGDTQYYQVPAEKLAVPAPVLTWQGRPWAPVNFDKVKIDDPDMLKVGRDETSGLTIYRKRAGGEERFIKIDLGEYLQIQPR